MWRLDIPEATASAPVGGCRIADTAIGCDDAYQRIMNPRLLPRLVRLPALEGGDGPAPPTSARSGLHGKPGAEGRAKSEGRRCIAAYAHPEELRFAESVIAKRPKRLDGIDKQEKAETVETAVALCMMNSVNEAKLSNSLQLAKEPRSKSTACGRKRLPWHSRSTNNDQHVVPFPPQSKDKPADRFRRASTVINSILNLKSGNAV